MDVGTRDGLAAAGCRRATSSYLRRLEAGPTAAKTAAAYRREVPDRRRTRMGAPPLYRSSHSVFPWISTNLARPFAPRVVHLGVECHLHTLPASRPASQIWRGAQADDYIEDRPAYKGMLTSGALDRCGVTLLAGKAVGAPFVGTAAATLAVSEVLRLLHGGNVHELIDVDLKAPEYRSAVVTRQDFSTLNPGYVPV